MKTTVLVDNLKFPEGPRWHDGKLWFCDLFARRVMVVDLLGEVQTVFIPTTESLDPTDSNARGRIECLQVDVPGAGLP